jgi:GH25 family lysozyme M1 (1,4-beta-N-acetylmuramidase)
MKLIFVKNLINNNLCKKIFNYLLLSKYKNNTKSFIKEFMDVCKLMNLNQKYVIENINTISNDFKNTCVEFENNTETELIITCLNNNHDFSMIIQLNLVTYAGPLYDQKKTN